MSSTLTLIPYSQNLSSALSSANGVARTLKKIRTSKGDYCIKYWFSTIISLFKLELLLKERIRSHRERILSLKSNSLWYEKTLLPHKVPVDTLPPSPPPTLGMGSVCQNSIFLEHGNVAYQIKENHECSNKVTNILPAEPYTRPPDLDMGSIGQISTFSELDHVAYQIKGNHEMQQQYFACRPPDSVDGVNRSKFVFFSHVHVK